ncbi:phenylalanine--tRNA ligase subunit beta [Paraliomyxa miuraensis]|uniref:phenylalanine--tRNA ligase subunit beta n=1 Tax=Paraliomyxa miuraensis TaxID=376150 RepID=UPI00225668A3|nr:phenylalanine--tRNA ligase subunit beta [Paraliomyxa miuraensis]MCX4244541.1 phenylalanine--tRNA ligase subunit beta [Paraliomyxa miuraensis]
MLISRAWLQEFLVDPAGEGLPSDAALSAAITSVGLEVEGVTRVGQGLGAIVVGQVRSLQPHPKADKLRVVELFDGRQVLTVVCGAPNVPDPSGPNPGKVAFAPAGTTLPGGLTLKAREVRGVQSFGMICSEHELQIGSDHDGILVLPSEWEAGDRLVDRVPGIEDTIFELSITPNRPDALGHVGVARDLAIKLGRTLVVPPLHEPRVAELPELVTLEAPDRCGRYFGYAFEGARVGPSPLWLRVRLHRLGLRPINDVVDITNLVLMEWGQPLHAFDRAALADGRVVIRLAREGERMHTLDERELTLCDDDLVIADASAPQALAGVMGGKASGVQEGTTTLLLEAAWFHPRFVRRTARRHQISTDSSHRFERGVDHGMGLHCAVKRAFGLIEALTGARCVGGHLAKGQRPAVPSIALRPDRTRMVLGMDVSDAEAKRILTGLQIEIDDEDPKRWICRPPTHRPDLVREEDLIEEVMRIHGLDDLPAVACMPTAHGSTAPTSVREPGRAPSRGLHDPLVDALAAQGLHEAVTFAFGEPDKLARVEGQGLDGVVALRNPMRGLGPVLRTHLLPGLLDAAALNLARHGRPVRLFEVGRIYRWGEPPAADGPTAAIDRLLPDEPLRAGVLLAAPAHRGAALGDEPVDGRAMAGILLDALARVGLEGTLAPAGDDASSHLHPGVQALVRVGERTVGGLGAVHPDLVEAWELPTGTAVVYGELRVDELPAPAPVAVKALPRFPATSRDLSLDLSVELPAADVVAALVAAANEAGASVVPPSADPPQLAVGDVGRHPVEVVEDYRGAGVEDGRRALLLRLGYRAHERTVTDDEVQRLHEAATERALQALRRRDPKARVR